MQLRVGVIWLVLVALAVSVYVVTDEPAIQHSSALNTVFDTRWMIAGARLLAVATMVYVLASIAVRANRGQWVRSAGPVDTDAPTQAIADDQEDLQEQLRLANGLIADLDEELRQARATIQALSGILDDRRAKSQGGSPGGGTEDGDDTES